LKNTTFAFFAFFVSAFSAKSQIITEFTWDNAALSPMQALIGPNATSISSNAVISASGYGGTDGLNPGSVRGQNVNMVLPGSYYMVNALDISVSFKMEEGQASFFTLGNFDFGVNSSQLYFVLPLDAAGSPGYTLVNKIDLYSLPNDNAFHTYRFLYNNLTGVVTLYADGSVVYTYNGTPDTNMNWTGAGDATVGVQMDGGGGNIPVLDNLIIQNSAQTILPLELLSFNAQASGNTSNLTWSTSQELNERNFSVERSADGISYEIIGTVAAKGGFSVINHYQFTDQSPLSGANFYRVLIKDNSGNQILSDIQYLIFGKTNPVSIHCFPNPTVNYINVSTNDQGGTFSYSIFTMDGKTLQEGNINLANSGNVELNVANAPRGILLLVLRNSQNNSTTTIKIAKE